MNVNKKSRWFYFKKNLPLTLMALPGVALMVLFKYLPLSWHLRNITSGTGFSEAPGTG